jgi:hypothetical protein
LRQGPQEADPLIADAHPPLRFSAERRLRRKVDFDTTYQQGRRYGDALLSMTVRSNTHGGPRLGSRSPRVPSEMPSLVTVFVA